jgi:hypothetical protein
MLYIFVFTVSVIQRALIYPIEAITGKLATGALTDTRELIVPTVWIQPGVAKGVAG